MRKYVHKLGMSDEWKFIDVYDLSTDGLHSVPRPVAATLFLFPSSQVCVATGCDDVIQNVVHFGKLLFRVATFSGNVETGISKMVGEKAKSREMPGKSRGIFLIRENLCFFIAISDVIICLMSVYAT